MERKQIMAHENFKIIQLTNIASPSIIEWYFMIKNTYLLYPMERSYYHQWQAMVPYSTGHQGIEIEPTNSVPSKASGEVIMFPKVICYQLTKAILASWPPLNKRMYSCAKQLILHNQGGIRGLQGLQPRTPGRLLQLLLLRDLIVISLRLIISHCPLLCLSRSIQLKITYKITV